MNAKEKRERRREQQHYGMTKIKEGQKLSWLSVQNRNGWSLGLALNSKTLWLRNTRFATRKAVEQAFRNKMFIGLKK